MYYILCKYYINNYSQYHSKIQYATEQNTLLIYKLYISFKNIFY